MRSDDTIIMVKVARWAAAKVAKTAFFDIADGIDDCAIKWRQELFDRPKIGVLTMAPHCATYAQCRYPRHNIIWIPHVHCNNESRVRLLTGL